MERRELGKTGIQVSEIAFGGVEIGMPYGLGNRGSDVMPAEKESIKLIQQSLELGINFFDTARQYGQSEYILGKAFKERRKDVVICTKCKHLMGQDKSIPNYTDLDRMVTDSLNESLFSLQTDYLDIFMVHQVNDQLLLNTDIQDIFLALKSKGIVRSIGVSTYTLEETKMAIESGVWDVIQLPFNLLDQHQKEMFGYAKEKGVAIVIRSVLLKGLLSGVYTAHAEPLKVVEEHIQKYKRYIGHGIQDLPSLAIQFALSFDEIGSVLVGLDRYEYLLHAVNAAGGEELSMVTKKSLESLQYPDPGFLNLHQWTINGWLK